MDILHINIKSLKYFHLWPNTNLGCWSNMAITILHHLILFGSLSQVFGCVGYQCVVGIEDINILVESIIAVGDYFGFMFIFICFRLNLYKIKKVIKKSSVFLEYCHASVIEDAEKEVQFYTKGLIVYFMFGITLNSSLPLLDYKDCNERRLSDYYRLHDPCGMPTRIWLPFEVNRPTIYYLILALHTNACIQISCTVLMTTMTLVGLLIHTTAQIKNLRKYLLDVFSTHSAESEADSTKLHKKIEQKLKFCVKYHITIIEYANNIFEAFNLMLLVHVCLTSVIFGIIGYQIVAVDAFIDKFRYFLHLMGWIGMLYLTCFYGQMIINESTTIADAAYQTEWFNGPLPLRRIICLIIMRSQRSLKLKAASIGVISLETFVSVMKTAYSYFALLLSIAK